MLRQPIVRVWAVGRSCRPPGYFYSTATSRYTQVLAGNSIAKRLKQSRARYLIAKLLKLTDTDSIIVFAVVENPTPIEELLRIDRRLGSFKIEQSNIER